MTIDFSRPIKPKPRKQAGLRAAIPIEPEDDPITLQDDPREIAAMEVLRFPVPDVRARMLWFIPPITQAASDASDAWAHVKVPGKIRFRVLTRQ